MNSEISCWEGFVLFCVKSAPFGVVGRDSFTAASHSAAGYKLPSLRLFVKLRRPISKKKKKPECIPGGGYSQFLGGFIAARRQCVENPGQ